MCTSAVLFALLLFARSERSCSCSLCTTMDGFFYRMQVVDTHHWSTEKRTGIFSNYEQKFRQDIFLKKCFWRLDADYFGPAGNDVWYHWFAFWFLYHVKQAGIAANGPILILCERMERNWRCVWIFMDVFLSFLNYKLHVF